MKKSTKEKTTEKTTTQSAKGKRFTRPMPFLRAFHQALDWALDIAVSRVDHADDIAAVERVRDALRSRIEGRFVPISIEDLLFSCDVLITAMETDLHPISRNELIND